MWRLLLPLLLVGSSHAQDSARGIARLDGYPDERVYVQGTGRWVHDDDASALLLAPSDGERFYGFTMTFLRGAAPNVLRLRVCNEAEQPAQWQLRLEDDAGYRKRGEAADLTRNIPPGWSDVDIDIRKLRNQGDRRTLDFRTGIRRLRWSRRKGSSENPACRVSGIFFVGEEPASAKRALAVGLRNENIHQRSRAIRENLPKFPAKERRATALQLLRRQDLDERSRRATREAVATLDATSVDPLLRTIRKSRGPRRLELLWALAAMPSPAARKAAIAIATDPRTDVSGRTAVIQGLGRRGREDLGSLLDSCPLKGPWAPRAALVKALLDCASPGAIDTLIKILSEDSSGRVSFDAADALTRLTGKDLGTSAQAWADWWKVNKGKVPLNDTGARVRSAYGTYYGIPMPTGAHAFVIDTSGSMRDAIQGGAAAQHIQRSRHLKGKKIERRLDLAREELIHALEQLDDKSRISVIPYDDAAKPIVTTKGLERASSALVKKIARRIRTLSPGGKTNIYDGLWRAFHPGRTPDPKDVTKGPDTIFLLTDGSPSAGQIVSRLELRDAVLRWNIGRMIRVHAINVGTADNDWLRNLTGQTGGQFLDLTSDPAPKKENNR